MTSSTFRLKCALLVAVAALSALAAAPALAQASDYPNKPVEFVLPVPPGGAADTSPDQVGGAFGAAE